MPGTVYLTFHDQITPESANRIISTCNQAIQQLKPDKLYFLFSSGGGTVDSGITIYNYLRGLPAKIAMHNTGSIDSIANAIFLAGDERYANSNSAFLFHGIFWTFAQQTSLSYTQMQETVSRFDSAEQLFANIIGERTHFTSDEVRKLFRQGQSKDPHFALSRGVIHEIKEVSVPEGSPLLSIGQPNPQK